MDGFYLDTNTGFISVSRNIVIDKLTKLGKWTVKQTLGRSTPSTSSQLIQIHDVLWLMHQGVVLPSRGTSTRLEKWAGRKLTKFSKGKCKVMHLRRNKPYAPVHTED